MHRRVIAAALALLGILFVACVPAVSPTSPPCATEEDGGGTAADAGTATALDSGVLIGAYQHWGGAGDASTTSPGGSNTQVQYNCSGSFCGSVVTYDGVTFTFPTTIKMVSSGNVGTISWTPTSSRTWTLPDVTDTATGLAATQTLTNKTIDAASNTITNLANANVSASAAIVVSKLAGGTNGYWLKTVGTTPTWTALAVNAATDLTGITPIANGGTGASSIGLTNTVATSGGASGPIVWQTIVNANVSASAAIAGTKISPDFGSQNVTTSGNASLTGASSTFTLSGATAPSIVMTTGSPFIQLGATPATAGQLRMLSAADIEARNAGNTANVALVKKISDDVYLSDGTNATNTYVQAKSTGVIGLVSNATVIAQATSAALEVASGKNLSLGATAPTYGSGTNTMFWASGGTEPSSSPTSGALTYVVQDSGSGSSANRTLRLRDTSGFITQIGGDRQLISSGHSLTAIEAGHPHWYCSIAGGTLTAPVGGNTHLNVYDRIIVNNSGSDCLIAVSSGLGSTQHCTTGHVCHMLFDKDGAHTIATGTYP